MKERPRRMAMTLPPETADALFDLADAIERPAATVAQELLTEIVPQLHDLAKIARLTKAGKGSAAKRALVHMIGDSMGEILGQQLDLPTMKRKK